MNILLVTGSYAGGDRQPWLLDDLAEALVHAGHSVDVIVSDTKFSRPVGLQPPEALRAESRLPELTVFSTGPSKPQKGYLGKLIAYCASGYRLHTIGYHQIRNNKYDLCIFTSIAAFSWGFPRRVRHSGIAQRSLLFLWDFFPIHQLEIGRIKTQRLAGLLKFLEFQSIKGTDIVALMSPANVKFFDGYHPGLASRKIVIPPWSGAQPAANMRFLEAPLKVIFGGQIAKGRGVDTLLDVAQILLESKSSAKILIAGDGSSRSSLESDAARRGLTNVCFLGSLPRDEYRKVARSAHLGVAITVAGVTPPSFPSKIIEYCGLGLPVLVCVEDSSDADELIVRAGAGFSAPAGDPEEIAEMIQIADAELAAGKLNARSLAAKALFKSDFSVNKVVERIMQELDESSHEVAPNP